MQPSIQRLGHARSLEGFVHVELVVPPHILDGVAGRLLEEAGDNLVRLQAYGWPGNVRELRNVLQRAVALSRKPKEPPVKFAELIFNLGPAAEGPATLGTDYPGVASHMPYKEARAQLLDSFDRAYIAALMGRHADNATRAAMDRLQILGAGACAGASGTAASALGFREFWTATAPTKGVRELYDSVSFNVAGIEKAVSLRTRLPC